MKRAFGIFVCAALLCLSFTGCGNDAGSGASPAASVVAIAPEVLQTGVVPHNTQIKLDFTKNDIIQLDGLTLFEETITNQYVKEGIVKIENVGFEKTTYYFMDESLELLTYTKENADNPNGDYDTLKAYFAKSYGEGSEEDRSTLKRITWENNVLENGTGYQIVLSCYPERKSVSISIQIMI